MPVISDAKEGHFCWVELQTTDVAAAKSFYGELFGWAYDDAAMPGGTYSLAKIGADQVAGMLKLPEQAAQMGAPPSWGCYVKVADVAATTSAAERLGGKVLMGPTSMGPGTFSVLADPTGGVFMLWGVTKTMGTFLYREPGALTWNELVSTNVDVAQRFYTQLFGWKAEAMPMNDMTYVVFKQGEDSIGGLMPQPKESKGAPSMWASYFEVADADATLAAATKRGAKVLMPLVDIPNVGRLGWLQDPQGVVFAIIKNSSRP